MTVAIGISNTGDSAEEAFRRLTGARPPIRAADGDAVLDGCHIEVKKASADTLNQVRAVKFIPLVALHSPTGTWYVIPAPDVVKLVAQKERGQHTENPFESATLSLKKLDGFKVRSESLLATAVREAIERGKSFPRLEAAMRGVLTESKRLALDSRLQVTSLLTELRI
jgi:hypothetical protein